MAVLANFAIGFLRSGRLHLPIYGVFAVAGLLSALWLSQRTAPKTGLSPEKLWDAGVFAIGAAFFASRVLLIAQSPRSFMRFPLLLLALPSFTYAGMLLTPGLTWALSALEAAAGLRMCWTPGRLVRLCCCAALQLGHFAEGTDAGMPTRLPWGVIERGSAALGPTHPVEFTPAFVRSPFAVYC